MNNKEEILSRNKKWRENNKEKTKQIQKKWNEENPDKIKAIMKKYRKNNIEKERERKRKWNEENREKIREQGRINYKKKSSQYKKRNSEYRKRNPDKVRFWNANRKKSIKQATPKWLTKEHKKQILGFYTKAQKLEEQTGIKHHVDHIMPIKNQILCGLHVPWNLQVITKEENLKKHNKILEVICD